jgi:hypothetical protein
VKFSNKIITGKDQNLGSGVVCIINMGHGEYDLLFSRSRISTPKVDEEDGK